MSLICVLIVLNIFLVMSGVVQEKKDKVLLFVLSLPVSTTQYTVAKVLANAIAFTVPWLVLTAANIVMIDVRRFPNGLLPFWVTVLGYLLFYYCALLGRLAREGLHRLAHRRRSSSATCRSTS